MQHLVDRATRRPVPLGENVNGNFVERSAAKHQSLSLGETLVELTRGGRTLIVTTHDDDFARDFATRVVILAEGEIVEEGNPREVLTNPQHAATRALLQGVQ